MIAVLLAATVGAVLVGTAVVARHRAQAAADLASLAGAARLAAGAEAACAQVAAVARAMQTSLANCVVDELDVIVTVDVAVGVGRLDLGPARAAARAGPSETSG
jgi:secretion/DNA translocation related TadE-like protein